MAADLAIKEPVRAATTGNITLSGLQTIDGVALASGDRVLVRAQSTATQNGLYTAASGSWTRTSDFDGAGEVTGGTQMLVTSGDTFADSAWRVAGEAPVTPGSSAIAFDPEFLASGTGAVPRSAALKLHEAPVTPEDFGAAGDGDLPPTSATDDTAAVQAAMDAAAAEGRPLYLKKMYMVTDTITWQKQGDNQGPIIFGDGQRTSGLKPSGIDGPVLRIDGSSLEPYAFAHAGWLHDFRIFPGFVENNPALGFCNSGDDTTGVELIGFIYGCIERVEVQGLTGSAIVAPRRLDLENTEDPDNPVNSDGYQTQAEVRECDLRRNGGWGVDGDSGIGCTLSLFDNFSGVRLGGGAWRIIRNAIASNGSAAHGGGGILTEVMNGTPHTVEIYNNEIETNYDYGIDLGGMTSPRIIQNRFNASKKIFGGTIVRPPVGVRAGFSGSGVVTGLQAEQNEFRNKVNSVVTSDEYDPDSAITAWQLNCGTGRCADADILKSRFSSTSANLTKYARGGGALLTPTVSGGVITGVTVVAGGQGYSGTVKIVAFAGGGTGFQATATIGTGGDVTGATITNGGSGYSSTDTRLAVKPPERQGFNYNDSIRIREAGFPLNTGGQAAFKIRLLTPVPPSTTVDIATTGASLSAKKIVFDTEESDFADYYYPGPLDPDTLGRHPGELVFPCNGTWLISVTLRADLGGAGTVNLYAYVDGSLRLMSTRGVTASGDNSFTLQGNVWVAGGEVLTIHADNSTGAAKALTGGVNCNHLSVALAG